MNPNLQNLDPKLKETYDKVMAAQFSQPAQKKEPVPPTPSPIPSMPNPTPVASPSPVNSSQSPAAQVFVASPATPTGKATNVKSPSGKKISPIIFVVLGLAFFAVYTLVWLKVFGII